MKKGEMAERMPTPEPALVLSGAAVANVSDESARGARVAADASADDARFPYWRRNRIALSFCTFSQSVSFGLSFPFLPLVLKEMGIATHLETWVGYLIGTYFTLSFLLTPMWGVVADHYGRKAMVLRTSFGMALVYLLLPFAPSVYWFVPIFLLMGTTNGLVASAQALAATTSPPWRMGSVLSLIQSAGLIGGMIGPVIGAALAEVLPSYRDMYWFSAAASGMSGVFALLLAREKFIAPVTRFELHLVQDFRQIIRLPNAIVLFMAFVAYTLTLNGSVPVISVYVINLLHKSGAPETDAPFWLGVVSIALPIGAGVAAQVWGRVMDRVGPETVLTLGLFFGAIALIPIVFATAPLHLAGARLLLGIGAIGIGPAGISMLKARAPAGMDSRVLAYLAACGMLGMGVGPFIAGQIGPLIGLPAYFALNALALLVLVWAWRPGSADGPTMLTTPAV
jgi:MFS transporter, DHA1 family, multidrug resistance protein